MRISASRSRTLKRVLRVVARSKLTCPTINIEVEQIVSELVDRDDMHCIRGCLESVSRRA